MPFRYFLSIVSQIFVYINFVFLSTYFLFFLYYSFPFSYKTYNEYEREPTLYVFLCISACIIRSDETLLENEHNN
jgi:hypothetical protein